MQPKSKCRLSAIIKLHFFFIQTKYGFQKTFVHSFSRVFETSHQLVSKYLMSHQTLCLDVAHLSENVFPIVLISVSFEKCYVSPDFVTCARKQSWPIGPIVTLVLTFVVCQLLQNYQNSCSNTITIMKMEGRKILTYSPPGISCTAV